MNPVRAVLEELIENSGYGKALFDKEIDSTLASIARIIEAEKKSVPKMITIDYLEKIGVEETALLVHIRSEILGWNVCCNNISKLIRGESGCRI